MSTPYDLFLISALKFANNPLSNNYSELRKYCSDLREPLGNLDDELKNLADQLEHFDADLPRLLENSLLVNSVPSLLNSFANKLVTCGKTISLAVGKEFVYGFGFNNVIIFLRQAAVNSIHGDFSWIQRLPSQISFLGEVSSKLEEASTNLSDIIYFLDRLKNPQRDSVFSILVERKSSLEELFRHVLSLRSKPSSFDLILKPQTELFS